MRRPVVRWSVLIGAIAAAVVCCVWAAALERATIARRRALSTAVADGRGVQASLADARRALSAMASPGQAAASWSRQATASIETARARLATLAAADGGAVLAPMGERVDRLIEAERRVRENAVGGRTLMASDVAFGEALPQLDAIDSAVADAVAAMATATERGVAATRTRQLLVFVAALGALGLAALILTPIRDSLETIPAVESTMAPELAPDAGLSLRPSDAPEPPVRPQAPWVRASPAGAGPEPPVADLAPLATACSALAELADSEALPAALEAARVALGARGLAVWLANPAHTVLGVVASAGYDRQVVERFPLTRVTDGNLTTQAFESGTASTTPPDAGRPAALAVPIGGVKGRTGVLSAELVDGAVADRQVVARARIVAAQLATLLETAAAPAEPSSGEPPPVRAEHA